MFLCECYICNFLWYPPRSGIAASYGNSMLNISKYCQATSKMAASFYLLAVWKNSNSNFSATAWTVGILSLSLFFFFLVVLGFELKALRLLGRHSTTWAILPVLFCVEYFQNRISWTVCPGWLQPPPLRDPPDLCLLSSKDYRHEPPVQGGIVPFWLGAGDSYRYSNHKLL
jgi:hypothetical protein